MATNECLTEVEVPKSSASHHFKVLRESGVTSTTQQGTRLLIRLRQDDLESRFPGLLQAILNAYRKDLEQKQSPVSED
jgi:DNA-binding transcriptional ArsR family regulator